MRPNLVIIGAQKAGTTSLYHYLALHPEVWMSAEKELSFFVAERNWSRGVGWYERWFRPGYAVNGEASPDYADAPHFDGVPERMAGLVPDARIVYLVRDPVARLLSQYAMRWAQRRETRPLAVAVADPASSYVSRGRYWSQLERYLAWFPAERVRVIDLHDLEHDRAATLHSLFAWLGVDETFSDPGFAEVHMPAFTRRRRRPTTTLSTALDRALGTRHTHGMRQRVPEAVYRLATVPAEPPALEPELRERLLELYAPEAARLRAFTGQAFSGWSV